ncbi:MAG TPA: thioredoxin domain-containing protein, partial [Thermoanaerobaculia bacterium]|nr:thioredoxin domain-containing protein [Thermoanaerobaculia bacterium]
MSDETPRGTAAAPNRLAGESSPYLLLHAGNPVDWYPWGEEALARAKAEDRPIFLSVGYSTCYWCHVMERESFSDPEVARLMNERFVNVKVDREERPDVDEIYMVATQILAGQGGWPNSVFLTPELEPFYAGTYFPPEDRHGRPGFPAVLRGLADAWATRRSDIHLQAADVAQAMRKVLEERFPPGQAPPAPEAALRAFVSLERSYDPVQGGFGGAPKFPTPSSLFLLRELVTRPSWVERAPKAAPKAGEMLAGTLDAMARGGIYDQLGGGFHRYSTDARWLVPHFEKMLYDNALLLELYALEHERTGAPEPARIARETAAFLAREMTAPPGSDRGGFWSAAELREVLGDEDYAFLAPVYGFAGAPTFEGTEHVLHLPLPFADQAARRHRTREQLLAELAPLRERLFEARSQRPRPATDDKVLADWNGMAIRALAVAARALGDGELAGRAARAAEYVLRVMRPAGGPLLHAVREGRGRVPAYLSDYAFLARGLLALHELGAAGAGPGAEEPRWLEAAVALADELEERLAHPAGGWYNAARSPDLLLRSQEIFDGAMPAANAVAVLAMLELAEATGEPRFRERAGRALAAFAPAIERTPEAARMLAVANLRFAESGAGEAREGTSPERAAALAVVSPRLELGEPDEDGGRPF